MTSQVKKFSLKISILKKIVSALLLMSLLLVSLLFIFNLEKKSISPQVKTLNTEEINNKIATKNLIEQLDKKINKLNDYYISYQTEKNIQNAIAKVKTFFDIYQARLKGMEELIVRRSIECEIDYRIIIGIAGIESGLGRFPVGGHNPFGYLDGIYYNSWEEALNKLICVIGNRFIKPCNSDLSCIINKYGGPDTPKDHWIKNVQWFMNQV